MVKLTTRLMKGKMLMFSKTFPTSFVYHFIDAFCFPDENVKKIYEKYNIQKCFLYQNLTDTDSTSLFFIFVCNMNSQVSEKESRNIFSEALIQSKILKRLDLSLDDFWKQFNVQNPKLKNQVELYKVESIHTGTLITLAVNPKEYFEKYRNKDINKKH